MTIQRLALALTLINLLVLGVVIARVDSATASQVPPVLRGRALEIIDENGKVRAQVLVTPPTTMPDGKKYPETVLFRLIDPNGRPAVKIGASVEGSGMSMAGDSERRDWSGVQILAGSEGSTVKLTERGGREQTLKP